MAIHNAGALFNGAAAATVAAVLRMQVWPALSGAAVLSASTIQKFVLLSGAQQLAGAGLVDTWPLTHFPEWAYDPAAPTDT